MPIARPLTFAPVNIRSIKSARSELKISFEETEPNTSRNSFRKIPSKRPSAASSPPVPTASRN